MSAVAKLCPHRLPAGVYCARCSEATPAKVTKLPAHGLSRDEARSLTDEVKVDAERLWRKLVELYEGEAHKVLGYSSWGAYFKAEFGGSKSRAYQLLDSGRVLDVVRQSTTVDSAPANEAQARELAPLLDKPEVLRETWAEVIEQHPEPTAQQVRDIVQQKRPGPKTADRIARETGVAVIGSDNLIHTGKPPSDTRWQIITEWAEAVRKELPPPGDLHVPDYAQHRDIEVAAMTVRDWLDAFLTARKETP